MSQGVVVNLVPVAMDEGTDQQQQRGLRLMEIGDEHLDNLIVVARRNDNLRGAVENRQLIAKHPVEQSLQDTLNVLSERVWRCEER